MTITSRNPHDPADVIGEWQPAGGAEVAAAVERAAAAAPGWAGTSAQARAAALAGLAEALEQRAGEVTDLIIREVGKPRSEAAGEVARGVAILRYFAQAALLPDGQTLPAASPGTLLLSRHHPVGVTGLVTPWNFPVAIPLWKAAPSLAFGNATVLKPSEESSAVALLLAGIILVGPVISARARDSALAAIAASGGTVLAGGAALDAPGYYLAPTLAELDTPAGPLATEEVFAPVAALLRAGSAESAVQIANGVRYGLVTSLFTQDLGRALRLADQFDTGMVRVNAPTSGVDFHAPFGGAKQSSYGPREQGLAARDFYTETRTVTIVP